MEEFHIRVKARGGTGFREVAQRAKAVARVLQEAVSAGEMNDVLQILPDEFNELFTMKSERD